MPGDPLRARWIAEEFLEGATCYSEVRGMFGFTGTYRGERISVQGSGMGLPSLSFYVNELCREYDVRTIVRVGSCGALTEDLRLRDLVIGSGACTDSSMNRIRFEGLYYAPVADFELLRAAHDAYAARDLDVAAKVGLLFSGDSFYSPPELTARMVEYGVLAVEMEASAPYTLAAQLTRRAAPSRTTSSPVSRRPRRSVRKPSATWSRSPSTPCSPSADPGPTTGTDSHPDQSGRHSQRHSVRSQ